MRQKLLLVQHITVQDLPDLLQRSMVQEMLQQMTWQCSWSTCYARR
jgi:hypothetical protein